MCSLDVNGAFSLAVAASRTLIDVVQGPPARATRRALLEESKQRRASENKPRQGIFETLRQVGCCLDDFKRSV